MIRKRWAVFLSGTGSNFSAMLERAQLQDVALVVCNRESAHGLNVARKNGIPFVIFEKTDSWEALMETLKNFRIENIFLMGFLKIIPDILVNQFRGRMLNIHPSFLPDYPGLKSIERAFEEKNAAGVTVHFVTEGVDEGPIILQKRISLQESLVETELSVHIHEHRLVRRVLSGV